MSDNSKGVAQLSAFDKETDLLNVIIETTKGSANKYDLKTGLFHLHKILPGGAVFPFDFGFIPFTQGEDGDPLDVLVLIEESAFTGCLVPSRLIGVIEAEQTHKRKTIRNDRLIAIADASHVYSDIKALDDLSQQLLDDIEHFFVAYLATEGKQVKVLGRFGS